jgi:hypothetical protein
VNQRRTLSGERTLRWVPGERGLALDIRKHLPEEFHRFLDWEAALVAYRQF